MVRLIDFERVEETGTGILYDSCNFCGGEIIVEVPHDGYDFYIFGCPIQEALPSLTPEEREALISNTCVSCQREVFEEPEGNDA